MFNLEDSVRGQILVFNEQNVPGAQPRGCWGPAHLAMLQLVSFPAGECGAAAAHCRPSMISHHPEDRVPSAAASPAPPATPMLFEGDSVCGPIGLALPRAPGALDAPDAATGAAQVLRLAQAEALICAVEQWLQGPWDPAPLAARAAAEPASHALVRDPALAPPGTRLSLPRAALLMPPPDALRAPALAWDAHPATVLLGEVPAEAADRLRIGGLLWLPASFGKAWAVRLIDAAQQLPPCPARLDLVAQRLTVAPHTPDHGGWPRGAAPQDALPDGLQVALSRPVQLPLDHWLGWGRADTPFHWPVPQPWAAELRQGGALRARGALLPMGAGCGLRIEWLAAPEAAH